MNPQNLPKALCMLGLAFFSIGATAKINHYPGADLLVLLAGTITAVGLIA